MNPVNKYIFFREKNIIARKLIKFECVIMHNRITSLYYDYKIKGDKSNIQDFKNLLNEYKRFMKINYPYWYMTQLDGYRDEQ
jgi:hypothetical protein